MIRWRYVLPRVAFFIALLVTLRYVLSPVAGYLTVQILQAVSGAKVELASVEIGLFPPRLHYSDIQIANPSQSKAYRNLASAEAVELTIDGGALLRRRYVIRDARVSGLQLDSQRLSSGHLEKPEKSASTQPSVAMRWLSGLFSSAADAAKNQLDALAESSETLRRGDQIRRRWKSEYESLARRATDLESSIKEVQQTAKGIDNPLRDWPRIDATLNQAKEIQQELLLVRKTLDELPVEFQADLLTMQRAKQADLQRAREALPLDLSASESLGPGLLMQVVKTQIDHVRGYLDTGREISQWTVAQPKVQRQRGEWIDLAPKKHIPSVLVRRCEVSGLLRVAGEPYQLTGILENLTPQPKLRAEPLRARVRLQGTQTVRLEYVRDDSSDIAHEVLTMHWPEIDAPTIRLGSPDTLNLNVRDGRFELWVQLDTRGDHMNGRLVSRRVDTHIDLQASDNIARTPMFSTLKNRLAAVDRIEIDAEFKGSWRDLDVVVDTNLTGVLKSGIREATAGQIEATREKMEAEINRLYTAEVTQLQQWLVAQQSKTIELLAKADSTVQEISRKVLSETGKADAYLGRIRDFPALK